MRPKGVHVWEVLRCCIKPLLEALANKISSRCEENYYLIGMDCLQTLTWEGWGWEEEQEEERILAIRNKRFESLILYNK